MAEIWLTIASDASANIADQVVAAIKDACEPLRLFPLAGPRREQFAPGLRVTFHNPYAIYYMALPDAVVVIRVLHVAQDVAALAERGAFDA